MPMGRRGRRRDPDPDGPGRRPAAGLGAGQSYETPAWAARAEELGRRQGGDHGLIPRGGAGLPPGVCRPVTSGAGSLAGPVMLPATYATGAAATYLGWQLGWGLVDLQGCGGRRPPGYWSGLSPGAGARRATP